MEAGLSDYAFVLCQYENSHQYALLSQRMGRINGITFGEPISPGSMITYSCKPYGTNRCRLDAFALHDMPLKLAHNDLLFLHHILELCFHFIPLGSRENQVYGLLEFLYQSTSYAWPMHVKKMIVLKLLLVIGHYPEVHSYDEAWLSFWCEIPLKEMIAMPLKKSEVKKVEHWLRVCVAEHPHSLVFKTTMFLNN